MSDVKVAAFSVSLDGFGAGPRQDLENPLGLRGFELHAWFQKPTSFSGIHLPKLGFKPVQTTAGEGATHVILKRA